MSNQTGIILQARLGSTRLPGKMLMPFNNETSLLEIILERLKKNIKNIKIVVATSTNQKDDELEVLCGRLKIDCFRGSENDVIDRFIGAAKQFNIQNIVRVCADNPFLLSDYITKLVDNFKPGLDYLSYSFDDGTPVIKSHIGLFAEMTTLKTLLKVSKLTNESIYLEHVTNYIYSNPNLFNVKFLPVDKILKTRQDIRLTVDTIEDFKLTQNLYQALKNDALTLENIIKEIDSNPTYKTIMLSEIKNNSK
jgi:spore coat polysaccharide biosynthesis protein SpsF